MDIKESFLITLGDMRKIIKDFHREMEKGLSGRKSSLGMIPAYAARPTGSEKGSFIALDLGGTNFRVIEVELKGGGKSRILGVKNFTLNKNIITGSGERLFLFLASRVNDFIKSEAQGSGRRRELGFTFSFPVNQTGIASGTLVKWTKGFRAKGVEGADVVKLLNEALAKKGLGNIKVAALVNDTVGTLAARSYSDRACDVGVIIGTGTNACCAERPRTSGADEMIINIEWGNFNKLRRNSYDKELDRRSENPSHQVLEKMVSGMYLGGLAGLVLGAGSFSSRHMSEIESDVSRGLSRVGAIAGRLGIRAATPMERRFIKEVCCLISTRASRISAAALAAVVTKIDPKLSRRHTVAIDGSVYEKHPHFAKRMKLALREIFGSKASGIRIVLTKDGSGKGAAIIAAAAASKIWRHHDYKSESDRHAGEVAGE